MKTRESKKRKKRRMEEYVEQCLWNTARGIQDVEMQRSFFIDVNGRITMRDDVPEDLRWSPSRCLKQANAILKEHRNLTRICHQERSVLNRCLMRRLNDAIESLKKDIRINEGCFGEIVGPSVQPEQEGAVRNGYGN